MSGITDPNFDASIKALKSFDLDRSKKHISFSTNNKGGVTSLGVTASPWFSGPTVEKVGHAVAEFFKKAAVSADRVTKSISVLNHVIAALDRDLTSEKKGLLFVRLLMIRSDLVKTAEANKWDIANTDLKTYIEPRIKVGDNQFEEITKKLNEFDVSKNQRITLNKGVLDVGGSTSASIEGIGQAIDEFFLRSVEQEKNRVFNSILTLEGLVTKLKSETKPSAKRQSLIDKIETTIAKITKINPRHAEQAQKKLKDDAANAQAEAELKKINAAQAEAKLKINNIENTRTETPFEETSEEELPDELIPDTKFPEEDFIRIEDDPMGSSLGVNDPDK